MISIWLAWLLVALPGYSFSRRFFRRDLAAGALGTLALAYFWTLALLSPIALVCYLTHAPLWVFSSALVLLVGAAVVDLYRRRVWTAWRSHLRTFAALELVLIAALVASAGLVGGLLSGDARFHCARIRQFLDYGFNNFDPYVLPHAFTRAYHSNIYHPLIATLSQLTGEEYLTTWTATLPWVKLVQAGGFYALAFTVFRHRGAAWIAAAVVLLNEAHITYSLCPNQLASHWLVPLALAQLTGIVWQKPSYRRILAFGAGLLVLVEVHALYALLTSLVGVLALALGYLRPSLKSSRRILLVALSMTLIPAPFLLASRLVDTERPASLEQPPALDPAIFQRGEILAGKEREKYEDRKDHQEAGRGVVNVGRWRAVDAPKLALDNYWLLGVLGLVACQRKLRHKALVTALAALMSLAFLHIPPLFTALADAGGGDWVALRIGVFKKVALFTLGPGALLMVASRTGWLTATRLRRQALCIALSLSWLVLFAASSGELESYFAEVRTTIREGRVDLTSSLKRRKGLLESLPRGAVVLTDQRTAQNLVRLHDIHVISAERISPRVPGGDERRFLLALALSPETPQEARALILRRYDVSYAYLRVKQRDEIPWLEPFVETKQRLADGWLFKLKEAEPEPQGVDLQDAPGRG